MRRGGTSTKHIAPFALEIYCEILFRNEKKTIETFRLKVSTFTLEINFRKPYVNNMALLFETADPRGSADPDCDWLKELGLLGLG